MKTFAVILALAASGCLAARIETITLDLERPQQPFALTLTEATDSTVSALLRASGSEFDPAGWAGLLWYGTSAGGQTLTNSVTGYGSMTWSVPVSAMPTNGRYSVQILGAISNRVEEWGRGAMTVRLNPSRDFLPAEWSTNNIAYAAALQALRGVAAVIGSMSNKLDRSESEGWETDPHLDWLLAVPPLSYTIITNPPWATGQDATNAGQWAAAQITLSGLGGVGTNDAVYKTALTNAALFATAAQGALATNRTTRLYSEAGAQWIDGTGGVWRVSIVTTVNSNALVLVEVTDGDFHVWDGEPLGTVFTRASATRFNSPSGGYVQQGGGISVMQNGAVTHTKNGVDTFEGVYVGDGFYGYGNGTLAWHSFSQSVTSALPRVAFVSDIPSTNGLISAASVAQAFVASVGGSGSNLTSTGKFTLANTRPTNLVARVYMSNEFIVVEHVIP